MKNIEKQLCSKCGEIKIVPDQKCKHEWKTIHLTQISPELEE